MFIKLPISVRDRYLLLARFSKKQVYIYYLLHYFYLLFTVNLVCCPTTATANAERQGPRVVLYKRF